MRRMAWTLVAVVVVGIGAAVCMRLVFEPPAGAEIASPRRLAAPARDAASPADPIREGFAERALAAAAARPGPLHAGAPPSDRAFGAQPQDDAQIEEELRWTERALAASRRIAEPAAAGRPAAASPASREALAAAASGSSAVALGCGGAGLACLSSADCCPGLACAGGVAGYGTPGRCEAPR